MSAFSGAVVLDFSQGIAGPMAAMLLADFGAEVIKVEPPAGDRMKDDPGYLAWNRNKRRLVLDLDDPADLAKAKAMIADADVALFDAAPGKLEAQGLDAASLTDAHPHLVHAWMPPYGVSGVWSQLPPHHSLLTALTGSAFRQGSYNDQPVHLILPLAHYAQGVMGASAIGAALYERSQSGGGQGVVVSGLHGISQVNGPVTVKGAPPIIRGAPLGGGASYRLYQCGDGQWLFLGTLFANFYRRAIDALELTSLLDEPGIDGDFARLMSPLGIPLAREAIEARFREKSRAEWLEILLAKDVPVGPVCEREEWFQHDTIAANGMRVTFQHPELGPVQIPGSPLKLSATPPSVRGLIEPLAETPSPAPARAAPKTALPATAPLAGVKVLDMGTVIAGAYANAILANLGAEVIKIEPREGDPFRSPTGAFAVYNRGKRALGLDLKQPAARELFLDMVRKADVVLDNYRLGVRARLGVDYAALRAVNPRIISCSITAYGSEGPQAALPGFDPLLQAQSGMMAGQGGGLSEEPIYHSIPVNDVASAAVAAFGVIAALNARERTGEGQDIETSLAAQSVFYQSGEMVRYEGRAPNDTGSPDCLGLRALHRYYECADGWVAVACATADEARAVGAALGLEIDDAEAALAAPRDGALAQTISARLAGRPRGAVLRAALNAGAPMAPALRGVEAYDSEWLWENGFFQDWTYAPAGDMIGIRSYADFTRSVSGFPRTCPMLGEHSREVLAEFGVAPERIEALIAQGAVFTSG